jgi:chemotaxis protein methyltransferase CheR
MKRSGGSLVESGEFPMTARDFDRIAAFIHAEAGISLTVNKANLVYSRLAKRLRILGLDSFERYCELVAQPDMAEERDAMIAALTTNVTQFFREAYHFDHLKTTILPPLISLAKQGGRVRLWSAACSSGQEPYSMALTILSLLPDAASYDIKILATDIDPNMLAKGQAGIYDASLVAPIPVALRQRWFTATSDGSGALQAGPDLRKLVSFRKLNLIADWPIRGTFHAIFCRNVVIYFDNDTQSTLWTRMVRLLEPGGALYIGHSERVAGPAEHLLTSDGITTYRLTGRDTHK